MPRTYTICINPCIPSIQHTQRKVPIEYCEHVEKTLQGNVNHQVIVPSPGWQNGSHPLTYPPKPDSTLHICHDTQDLNKAIIQEHYQVLTCSTPKEHDRHLIQLMQVATKNGLEVNSSKFRIRQPEISLYGIISTSWSMKQPLQGASPTRSPTPENQTILQSFPGLINYLQPFISGLANKTSILCKQLTEWDWNPCTDNTFQGLKSLICSTLLKTTLTYYDRTQPVIQTDDSEYGLAQYSSRMDVPSPSSKTVTGVKTWYGNIENESLSVCLGLEKFHPYACSDMSSSKMITSP